MNLLLNIFLILVLNFSVLVRPAFPLLDCINQTEIKSSSHSILVQRILEKANHENKNIPLSSVNLLDAPISIWETLDFNFDACFIIKSRLVITLNQIKTSELTYSIFQPPENFHS